MPIGSSAVQGLSSNFTSTTSFLGQCCFKRSKESVVSKRLQSWVYLPRLALRACASSLHEMVPVRSLSSSSKSKDPRSPKPKRSTRLLNSLKFNSPSPVESLARRASVTPDDVPAFSDVHCKTHQKYSSLDTEPSPSWSAISKAARSVSSFASREIEAGMMDLNSVKFRQRSSLTSALKKALVAASSMSATALADALVLIGPTYWSRPQSLARLLTHGDVPRTVSGSFFTRAHGL